MTGVLYRDDAQIVKLITSKVYLTPDEPSGARILIYPIS
jgi:Holliday junction resolvase RusA-like endonuclease